MRLAKFQAAILALAATLMVTPVPAMDTLKPEPQKEPEKKKEADKDKKKDAEKKKELQETRDAIARQDWPAAVAAARAAVARDPLSADAHNLYAYAIRKGAQPRMDLVFRHYNEALRIDPQHRGAHEYLGEAYLMTGNLGKAKEHLAILGRLCAAGCEERAALQRAVAFFETSHASK